MTKAKRWKREGRARQKSQQYLLISSRSHFNLKDLSISLYNHSLDFLLSCKDPASKERALLQRIESERPKLECRDKSLGPPALTDVQLKRGEEGQDYSNNILSNKTASELNLKPFSLKSVTSACEKDNPKAKGRTLGTAAVRVVRPMAISSRTRNMLHNRLRGVRAFDRSKLNKKGVRIIRHTSKLHMGTKSHPPQKGGSHGARKGIRCISIRGDRSRFSKRYTSRSGVNKDKSLQPRMLRTITKAEQRGFGDCHEEMADGEKHITSSDAAKDGDFSSPIASETSGEKEEEQTPSVASGTISVASSLPSSSSHSPHSLPSGVTRYVKVSLVRVSLPGEPATDVADQGQADGEKDTDPTPVAAEPQKSRCKGGKGVARAERRKGVREMYFTPVNIGSADGLKVTCNLVGNENAVTQQDAGKEVEEVQVGNKGNNERQEIVEEKESNDTEVAASSAGAVIEKASKEDSELVAGVLKGGLAAKGQTKDSVKGTAEGEDKKESRLERQGEMMGQTEDNVQKKTDTVLHIGSKTVVIKEARVILSDVFKGLSSEMISRFQDGRGYHSVLRNVSRQTLHKKDSEYVKRLRTFTADEKKDLNLGSDLVKKNEAVAQNINNPQALLVQSGAQMAKRRGSVVTALSSKPFSPVKGSLDHSSQSSIPLKKRAFRESLEHDPDAAVTRVETTLSLLPVSKGSSSIYEGQILPLDSAEIVGSETCTTARSSKTVALKRLHSRKGLRKALVQSHARILRDRVRMNNLRVEKRMMQKSRLVKECDDAVKETREGKKEGQDDRQKVEILAQGEQRTLENAKFNNQANAAESLVNTDDEQSNNLKIRLKRKRGMEWEMEGGSKGDGAAESGDAESCTNEIDPFKAILDSVAILNLEMERIRGHGEADNSVGLEQATKAVQDVLEHCRKESTVKPRKRRKKRFPFPSVNCEKQVSGQKSSLQGKSEVFRMPGPQNLLLKDLKKEADVADIKPLPLLRLRRKSEGRWEVEDSEAQKQDANKGPENSVLSEPRIPTCVPPESTLLGQIPPSKVKVECLSPCQHQTVASSHERIREVPKGVQNSEPLPLALSLSPLSLNSPYTEGLTDAARLSSSLDFRGRGRETDAPQQAERTEKPKTGGVITTASCLSHNLSQINKSLSKLQAMSQQPPSEKCMAAYASGTTSCQIQSKPLSPPTSPFTTECTFSNYSEDILDFQCLNLEGYDQTQAQSSLTDYCPGEPHNTGSFSSPFSQSPADGWNPETPYLGSPSPGSSFSTAEDLSFPDLGLTRDEPTSLNSGPYYSSKEKTFCPATSSAPVKDSERNMFFSDAMLSKRNVVHQTREDSVTPLCLADKMLGNQRDLIMFNSSSNTKQTVPPHSRPLSQSQDKLLHDASRSLSAQSKNKPNGQHQVLSSANKSQPLFLGQSSQNLYSAGSQGNPVKPFHSIHTGSKATVCSELPGPLNLGSALHRGCEKKPVLFQGPNSLVKSEGGHGQNVCKSSSVNDIKMFSTKPQSTKTDLSDSNPGPSGSRSHKDLSASCSQSGYPRYSENSKRDTKTVTPNKALPKLHPQTDRVYPVYFFSSNKTTSATKTTPVEKPQNHRVNSSSNIPPTFYSSNPGPQSHSIHPGKNTRQDKPHAVVAPSQNSQLSLPLDRNLCFSHCDPLDMNYSSSLSSAVSQHGSPQVGYRDSAAQNIPVTKSQPSAFMCNQSAHPSYVVNFTGDHSVTLDYSDDGECLNYSSSVPTNYTYHCLMEPSGTQGRLILEPCAPSNISHSPAVGNFVESNGLPEQTSKDPQQHGQPGCHSVISHHFPSSHSQNTSLTDRKPKRLRLVVTDGTVDLDLQYTD